MIFTSQRQQILDPVIIDAHRIEPASRHWLAVKSAVHFRAVFEPLAAQVVEVDVGGLATEQPGRFAYHHVKRPILPLDSLEAVNRARARMIKVESDV